MPGQHPNEVLSKQLVGHTDLSLGGMSRDIEDAHLEVVSTWVSLKL